MTKADEDFDRQMAIARELMDKHEVALSVLAQGENSLYWTDEFKARLEEASTRMAKYRKAQPI